MPELPDIDVYVDSLQRLLINKLLTAIRIGNPFLIRSIAPPPDAVVDHAVVDVRRIGKRIAIGFDNHYWLVFHLMIAGRLHWKTKPPALTSKQSLAALDFVSGSVLLTEAGTKKRASMHVAESDRALTEHDPGGLEPLQCSLTEFRERLTLNNHTVKRALTDPHIFSGIGNAYSDEILHAARLSPVILTQRLHADDITRLFSACTTTLRNWRERLLNDANGRIPKKVTAFHPDMAVHGKYGKPCPNCGELVQRIRYKNNETNYCASCQNDGRLLKDRSLSRLLKQDWPKTLDDM